MKPEQLDLFSQPAPDVPATAAPVTQERQEAAEPAPTPEMLARARRALDQQSEVWPLDFGGTILRSVKCEWCNADAEYGISRIGIVSGLRITSYACGRHAAEWQADKRSYEALVGYLSGAK